MSAMFITYLWHYLAVRALFDELLRPLTHGDPAPLLLTGLLVAVAFLLGRRSTRRSGP